MELIRTVKYSFSNRHSRTVMSIGPIRTALIVIGPLTLVQSKPILPAPPCFSPASHTSKNAKTIFLKFSILC